MNILFAHNNFPAQFQHLALDLAADPTHEVRAIAASSAPGLADIPMERYDAPAGQFGFVHPFARAFDMECRRAEQVLFAASGLASRGFDPDLVIVHSGWGENLPLRAVFPRARIAVYCEYYYRAEGQDVHFDPEAGRFGADGVASLMCRNASSLIALAESDIGIAPMNWQRSTFPPEMQPKIRVAHEGVDTDLARPNRKATLETPTGRRLSADDEVITFVARSLEPLRGFHIFMRALARVLRERPAAEVVVIGGDDVSYGPPAPAGMTWREHYLAENADGLDLSRLHFLGRVPHETFLSALQISTVHLYLSYPFVLSWSLVEAMSAQCRIVASDTAPVREAIDGDSGVLVPFFDVERLAEATIDVLERPAAYDAMAARARAAALARFDRNACVKRARRILGLD